MNEHAHRWRLEEPAGPMSGGRCAACGATRTFANSEEGMGMLAVRSRHEMRRARQNAQLAMSAAKARAKRQGTG